MTTHVRRFLNLRWKLSEIVQFCGLTFTRNGYGFACSSATNSRNSVTLTNFPASGISLLAFGSSLESAQLVLTLPYSIALFWRPNSLMKSLRIKLCIARRIVRSLIDVWFD